MSEEKKKKLRGLPGIVSRLVEPLNENGEFKERYRNTKVRVLLNAKDGKYAALIIINNGTIHVDGFKNKPKVNLKKKVAGWDGLIQAKTATLLELVESKKISISKVVGKIIIGKIKIRGIKKVLVLLDLFKL
ncbi:MAG: hypothetical protein ACXABO_14730 [Promethearchaeota archaeon]|jgi:hypothetical protein